ncbi:hypothetical protein [Arthrobacter sp. H16F315]|nr:hypothetical protein [Arthrobacter sp. H16F315]MDD1475882.1 hypothetical protein [Arthrobacter sp. H16F315]
MSRHRGSWTAIREDRFQETAAAAKALMEEADDGRATDNAP